MSVIIECPEAAGDPHNVVPRTGGGGIICASGHVVRNVTKRRHRKPREVERLDECRGWVVRNYTPVGNETPPIYAAHIPVDNNDDWKYEAIGGAECSDEGVNNTLIIWFVYFDSETSSTVIDGPTTMPFLGICADEVSCCQGSRASSRLGEATIGTALTMAPRVWKLRASGFKGAREVFNKTWTLKLRSGVDGFSVWNNGGDGSETPHVDLRCESPIAKTWRLSLKHKTKVAKYARPAARWDAVGANEMKREEGTARSGPDHLTVTPG